MNQRLFAKASIFKFAFFIFLISGFLLYASDINAGIDISEIVKSQGVNPESSALMITRPEDGSKWVSGGSRINSVYPPASTAKIPHTLIVLEVGYAEGPDTCFEWDGQKRFLEIWNQDQTLLSAYKNSAVWVYQQITRDLGHKVMSLWIDRFEYGNRFIGDPENITTYWLDGPLMTSVQHQVVFLTCLAYETLPLSVETFRLGKTIFQEDNGDDWVLYGKTGFSNSIGWYVGWVETKINGFEQTFIFAFNMDIESCDELPKRKKVVRAALVQLGIIFDK